MIFTRRVALISVLACPVVFAQKAIASVPSLPFCEEEPKVEKPPILFAFNKKDFTLKLAEEEVVRKNLGEVRSHLKALGGTDDDLDKLDLPEVLKQHVLSLNGKYKMKKKLYITPQDVRDSSPVFRMSKSPSEEVKEKFFFVKFGHPLVLPQSDTMIFNRDSFKLVKYIDPKDEDEKEQNGIYFEYTKNPDDNVRRAMIIPDDVLIILEIGDDVYFVDKELATKPAKEPPKVKFA